MGDKTLDQLFKEWIDKHSKEDDYHERLGIPKEMFIKDGIISPEKFYMEQVKTLFILNEANIKKEATNLEHNTLLSFQDYADGKEEDWSSRLREKIGRMYKVICGKNDMGVRDAVSRIAVMNLNKRGGGQSIAKGYLKKYVYGYQDEIREEIEIINPDLIVWCAVNTSYLMGNLYESTNYKRGKVTIKNDKEIKFVVMLHPSYCYYKNQDGKNRMDTYVEEFKRRYERT